MADGVDFRKRQRSERSALIYQCLNGAILHAYVRIVRETVVPPDLKSNGILHLRWL
jgi:hypothetical protein